MIQRVSNPMPITPVLYCKNSDGMRDVWLRKNIEMSDGECGTDIYEADEVFFRVSPDITENEITDDSDFYFDVLKDMEYGINADFLSVVEFRQRKRSELSSACEKTIFAGIDVELSFGTEHFSLTEKDQINLFGKQAQLASGAERLEYHNDGHPCKFYSVEDMTKIMEAAMRFVSYHTTYFNSLNMWLNGCNRSSEMDAIAYGAAVPMEYRSEVLIAYMSE